MPIDFFLDLCLTANVKRFLNASEVAKIVGVDRATVVRWIKRGLVKGAYRPTGSQQWRIPFEATTALLKAKV